MRARYFFAAAAAVTLAAVAVTATTWMLRRGEAEWSTDSRRALEEYRAALEARMRFYLVDAGEHLERALQLDPDFAMAKLDLALLGRGGRTERERLLDELRRSDLSRLQPRERFMVRYQLARLAGQGHEAREILAEHLEQHPKDPYAVSIRCDSLWDDERRSDAEACYRRLLKLHPNWVLAQNRLGYAAMSQGRFAEAEEHFQTYRYIAPDQANPYDSLGELLTLLGRYQEAEEAFRQALDIKPDFCAAYEHLSTLYLISGRLRRLEAVVDEMDSVAACQTLIPRREVRCRAEMWIAYLEGDAEAAWGVIEGERCRGLEASLQPIVHRVAVATGRVEAARDFEEGVAERLAEVGSQEGERLLALHAHMEGVRALSGGDVETAVERFAAADAAIAYWDVEQAHLKLFNRLHWVRSLEIAGRQQAAAEVLMKLREVNPGYAEHFEIEELASRLGIDLGRPGGG